MTASSETAASPEARFRTFLAKYSPELAAEARAALTRMRRLVPGAVELVYDNYNALVVGFGPNERASCAVLSLAMFPQWVTLCFIQNGPKLPDPERLLEGSGNVVRSVRLQSAKDLDSPAIRRLITHSLTLADEPIHPAGRRRMVIKSVSSKQRPRRPTNAKQPRARRRGGARQRR